MNSSFLCPCHSQRSYAACCQRYHDGASAENALILMRSRYSAYALHLADYIIETTHPKNPSYSRNLVRWKEQILQFSHHTSFVDLKILEFIDGMNNADVTFTAYLKQGDKDVTFTEKSHFIKVGGKWLYES